MNVSTPVANYYYHKVTGLELVAMDNNIIVAAVSHSGKTCKESGVIDFQ